MAVANIQIRIRIRLRPGNSFRETVFRRRMNESNRRTGFTSYVSRFPVKKNESNATCFGATPVKKNLEKTTKHDRRQL